MRIEKKVAQEFDEKNLQVELSEAGNVASCDHKQKLLGSEEDTKNNYCTSLDLIFNLKFNFMAFRFHFPLRRRRLRRRLRLQVYVCLSPLDFFSAIK